MKILFIIPGTSEVNSKSFYGYSFYAEFLLTKKYISYLLAIPTLAALTPEKHEIKILDENIEKIATLFPNCVTEGSDGKSIDFDLLKQELI